MAQTVNDLKHSEEEYFQKAESLIHSSSPVLRFIFRQRWEQTAGSPWSEASAEEFITGIGKDFLKGTKPIQRKCLKSGKLDEWDMSLLWSLLKQIKWKADDKESLTLQKKENQAIEKLVQLRNKCAHHSNKKLNEVEYTEVERVVRSQLKELGLSPEKIDGIVEKARVLTPVSGWTTAKKILQKGDEKFQSGDYTKAIEFYSEALQVPNLLQSNQAISLEKRAEARVALAEKMRPCPEKMVILDEALLDVKKSLEYDKGSWKAHQVIGKIHKLKNDLESAVKHLTRALTISPGQGEVKAELDCCKLLLGKIERAEHLDPRAGPMTFEERLKQFTDETGRPMTKETWLEYERFYDGLLPGQTHVQTGHRYLCGWDVKQDYLEASRHYAKADNVGNAEGTYNLAQLYLNGKGVQQCIERAVELLEKAAEMKPEINFVGIRTFNVGVRASQHSLGLLYDLGIHVPPDPRQAAMWYEKAAKNGLGQAANNLGILYTEGRGVKQNMNTAVMYWKLGVQQKDMNAAASLHIYYMKQMEPKLARIMFDRSIEYGNAHLTLVQARVYEDIREMEQSREVIEKEVIAFEKENKLSANGMTFRQRLDRQMKGSGVEGEIFVNVINDFDEIVNFRTRWAGRTKDIDPDELMQRAADGSITALQIIQVLTCQFQIEDMWEIGPPFSEEQTKLFVDLFYFCVTKAHHIIRFEYELAREILKYIETLFRIHGHAKSDMDMKLRICYAWDPSRDKLHVIEVLKVGVERYPEEAFYYDMLSGMYGMAENNKLGLNVAAEGLSRFPDDVGILYMNAVHVRLLQNAINKTANREVRQAYENFLGKAPKDHRKVPEAYYAMASSFMADFDMDNTFHYYNLGEKAEQIQLSCYLPYDSSSKTLVGGIVNFAKLQSRLPGPKLKKTKALDSGRKQKPSSSSSFTAPPAKTPPSNSKSHLENEWRIQRIKHHRTSLHDLRIKIKRNPRLTELSITQEPNLKQKLPWSLIDLKSIKLIEIDASKDHIYEGRILNLKIIEDPIIGCFPSVCTVAEDDDGDVTRIHVYNVPHNAKTAKELGFGSRLAVINPYMRIGSNDQIPFIRVDDPRCIIFNQGVVDMCRYCGEENAPHNCGRCKWAKYCSRKCQEQDWRTFKHKLICVP